MSYYNSSHCTTCGEYSRIKRDAKAHTAAGCNPEQAAKFAEAKAVKAAATAERDAKYDADRKEREAKYAADLAAWMPNMRTEASDYRTRVTFEAVSETGVAFDWNLKVEATRSREYVKLEDGTHGYALQPWTISCNGSSNNTLAQALVYQELLKRAVAFVAAVSK